MAALVQQQQRQAEEKAFFGAHYQDSDQVFTWENGRQVHPDVIRQRFNRAVAKAGLPPIRLHDVRHCYATAALASGISPKIVSERLGHASVAFTLSVYGHMIPGLDREAADQVAAMILGHGTSAPRASSMMGFAAVSRSVSIRSTKRLAEGACLSDRRPGGTS